ncbi:MAG TPA: glycogen debranching enzyme, partial [Agromyces sp.]
YCHDSPLTWLAWDADGRPRSAPDLLATTTHLIWLRAENPALRPMRFDRHGEEVPNSSQMDWFNADGDTMDPDDWNSPDERTLQYLAASTPEDEPLNRILLVVHTHESDAEVTLASPESVTGYRLLWDSAEEGPTDAATEHAPGDRITMAGPSMRLYRAHGSE